jgi:hypothetical protein
VQGLGVAAAEAGEGQMGTQRGWLGRVVGYNIV